MIGPKDNLVTEAVQLSDFVINLQFERAMVCLALFLDVRSGKATDLTKEYARTDESIQGAEAFTSLQQYQWQGNHPSRLLPEIFF